MLWKTGKILGKKDKEEETNVTKFQVIEGGLKTGGKEPPVSDWLTELTAGTTFLATPKQGYDPLCGKFTVKNHAEGEAGDSAVELYQEGHEFWVMAARFCHKMRLVAILERGI
jgi:hypothetical protein